MIKAEKREQVMEVMTKLVNDDELYCGGIPDAISELEEDFGLTAKQAGNIVSRLMSVVEAAGRKL